MSEKESIKTQKEFVRKSINPWFNTQATNKDTVQSTFMLEDADSTFLKSMYYTNVITSLFK